VGIQVSVAVASFAVGTMLAWLCAFTYFYIRAPRALIARLRAQLLESQKETTRSQTAAADTASRSPSLSFGRVVIPTRSQALILTDAAGQEHRLSGRIVRAAVVNRMGCETATDVHAQIEFMPGRTPSTYWPKEVAQGEWSGEGLARVEIDLKGNGRAHYLDVVAILDGDYPNAYEWTRHSRAAMLAGYAISASGFDVEIRIMGSGKAEAPLLVDTLRIEMLNETITADWTSVGPDEATNLVPWPASRRNWQS
jgi:hypothetical protein